MSTTGPALPSVTGNPPGISDVVSQQDLTTWAQIAGVLKYLTAPLNPPASPSGPSSVSPAVASSTFGNVYAMLAGAGVDVGPAYLEAAKHAATAGNMGGWAAWLISLVALLIEPLAAVVFGGLDALRKGIDPAVGELAVEVLNEFLGTEVTINQMPLGIGTGDHLQRGQQIGQILLSQLESEFQQSGGAAIGPSIAPAQTFAGIAVNFGLANGIMGLIGGLIPYGHWEELRELGEEVARNVGLGRLVRQALMPLVHILVAQPATWYYNTKYTPTQFTEGMLVNPYLASTLPHDQLYAAMNLLGYSNDKIDAFVKMHQKKLTPADAQLLVDNGLWDQNTAQQYISTLGWPTELVPLVQDLELLRRERGWYEKLIGELETEVKNGRMTLDEFTQILNGTGVQSTLPGSTLPAIQGLPFSQAEKNIIIATVTYKLAAHVAHAPHALSEGELVQAFEAGLLIADDLTQRWTALGLSEQDQNVRMALLLLRLSRLETVSKEKQAHYQQQLVAYVEKAGGVKPGPLAPVAPVPPFPINS